MVEEGSSTEDATGSTQTRDPELFVRFSRFVSQQGLAVVELLAPRAGERILDLGCGDGYVTLRLIAMGGDVMGVDASAVQVAAARRAGVRAEVMAIEELDFREEFDAVFSNATLHWVKQADRVIANVFRALKPGGRFVGELRGAGCAGRIREALAGALARRGLDVDALDPWYFPSAAAYRDKLEQAGFEVTAIDLLPWPTPLPGSSVEWLESFAHAFTAPLDAADRPRFLAEVQHDLRHDLRDAEGRWMVDYNRVRFRAVKPGG